MIRMNFGFAADRSPVILCIGAHSDDIEIGCGGTILRLCDEHPNCEIHWIVFTGHETRQAEARAAATRFAGQRLKSIQLESFRDGFLPYTGGDLKSCFESHLKSINPDLIFTHQRNDLHQDHRILCELTLNTFRNHMILEYEIPKYDGDLGQPTVFVPLAEDLCNAKVAGLMEVFQSQGSKTWFDERTFSALMRLRGMECHSPSGYAEAFYCRKIQL